MLLCSIICLALQDSYYKPFRLCCNLLSSAVNCISEVTFPGPAEFVAKAVILYGTPVSMWKRVQD